MLPLCEARKGSMFLHKDSRGYYGLYETVGGKRVYRAYIGKHPEAYLRDVERAGKVSPEFLALKGSLTEAIAAQKRALVPRISPFTQQYRTLVVDPPWPMVKILRDVRPNQADFDYPTMAIEEIKGLPILRAASPEGCHLYLWTTHKFLPAAFEVMAEWGFKYQCLLTWVKNVGFTPFSWMYSTELCLFGKLGDLPLLRMGKRVDFEAKIREHSRKPEIFYSLVREVSPAPRIDIFGREAHDGFDSWGNEVDKFQAN